MDFFCNDRAWQSVEEGSNIFMPNRRPEARGNAYASDGSAIVECITWGKHDFKFKFIPAGANSV